MNQKIKLPDGKEVDIERTGCLTFAMEDQIMPFDSLCHVINDEDGCLTNILPILFRHAHTRLVAIAEAIQKRFGEIEIVYGYNDTILDARLAPKEVVS